MIRLDSNSYFAGNTKEPSLLLNDALSKLKHWKSKYTKCKKERNNFENDLKEARL